jgi:hypothetical protein
LPLFRFSPFASLLSVMSSFAGRPFSFSGLCTHLLSAPFVSCMLSLLPPANLAPCSLSKGRMRFVSDLAAKRESELRPNVTLDVPKWLRKELMKAKGLLDRTIHTFPTLQECFRR